MTRRIIWRKPEREKIIRTFEEILYSFPHKTPGWKDGPLEYSTRLGALRCDVSCSETFLHVYLQFWDAVPNPDDLPRCWPGDLNPYSGKWNAWLTPKNIDDRTLAPLQLAELLKQTLTELNF